MLLLQEVSCAENVSYKIFVNIFIFDILGSNHYGIAGWYTIRAMNQGLIGLSGTNTSPLMTPTRSMEAGLGTNPLSFAAPAENGDSFVLDMATTAVGMHT